MIQDIKLSTIRIDGGTQPRAKIDTDVVAEYAERINAGDTFPAVDVFFDGKEHWLADGFHRYHGHSKAAKKAISCNVHRGTVRDAILFSCSANGHHGLRRTNADKRRAILALLNDAEWSSKSDRWIAEQCGVGHQMVASIRASEASDAAPAGRPATQNQVDDSPTSTAKRTGKDGKKYPAVQIVAKAIAKGEAESVRATVASVNEDSEPPESDPSIPPKLRPAFEAQPEFRSAVQQIGKVIGQLAALQNTPGGAFLAERFQEIETDLKNAQRAVKFCMPFQVCPYCKGKGCKRSGPNKSPCRETGWTIKGVKGTGE